MAPQNPLLPPLTSPARLRLGVEILRTYLIARWHLWRGDLTTTVESLRREATGEWVEGDLNSFWQGIRLAKATRRTLGILPSDSRCLMQSLVLLGLLSRRKISSVLIVAVKAEPDFKAHAWVEHDGRPLLPTFDFGRLVEL